MMIRLLVSLSLVTAFTVQAAQPADPWSGVAALFTQRLQQTGIVGGSVTFVQDGHVAHEAVAGFQDQATRRPVDRDTIFHWASITKTFTGIAIMQLRDRGFFSLDDPVVKYVPELREVHNPFGDISQVTIRHLMSHSGGFRAGTWPWGGDQPWHPFEPTRWAQLVAMMPYTELQFRPGTKYSYSNPGVIFLGRIIELFSGDDYEVYIAKNILMPLGMTRTFFDRAPRHLLDHRSHSYTADDDGTVHEQPFDFDSGITVSNGGLNAPLGDMATYLSFLIDGNDTILKQSSLLEMATPQVRAADGEGGSGEDVQAGLSCFIERHGQVELVGHSGDQNGFISHLYVHRPSRSGYIASFNTTVSSTRDPRHTTRAVDDDLRDSIAKAFWSNAGR
ncbi:MAG TPA: serine hydrolase domain-containing protein [Vicinamibacterales bacterium]|nr:serine hydrolase domain-containing protein [Vicinamibacterales bacterium]